MSSSLQKQYVTVLLELLEDKTEVQTAVTRLREVMARRGHERLLPATLKAAARQLTYQGQTNTLTIAHEKDKAHYASLAKGLTIEVDDKIIGGYILKTKHSRTDHSYRSCLLNWYRNTISKQD